MTKILFGRLRRDTMILLIDTDDSLDMKLEAEKAIREGQAQESFVVEVEHYFSASTINWDPEATNTGASSVPALNPGKAPQETTDESGAEPTTTIAKESRLIGEDSPKGPDTGTNSDLTPTGAARNEQELKDGKESGGVKEPVKTPSLDKK